MNDPVRLTRTGTTVVMTAALTWLLLGAVPAQDALAQRAKTGTAKSQPTKSEPAKPTVGPKVKGIFEPVNFKEDLRLDDVFFITPDLGYAAGASGTIIRTTDGGDSWTALLGGDPQSQERPITMLRFFDDRGGWAVQQDKLLRTTDGESWEEIGPTLPGLVDYVFLSETTGFAVAGGGNSPEYVYKSTNAGKTWKQVFQMRAKVEIEGLTKDATVWGTSLHFPTETTGYVVGGHPACNGCGGPPLIAKTEDGGETWAIWLGPGDPARSAIVKTSFLDEANGFIVLQDRKVFATSDGGRTWRGLVGSPQADLQFADPEVGWSFGYGPTLTYTVDGGRRWSSREVRLPAHARGFSLPRRDRAYIVGEHGMIYRYRTVPLDYQTPRMVGAPLMPGFDTSLDDDVETLATEVGELEEALNADTGEGGAAGGAASVDDDDPTGEDEEIAGDEDADDGEDIGEEDAGTGIASETVNASQGAGWSTQRYATRLEKIQATLAAVSADIPKFQGKLRNLNLIFFGLQIMSDLTDHGSSAQAALASFRSARDPESASAALAELSQAARALVATARTAFRGKAMAP